MLPPRKHFFGIHQCDIDICPKLIYTVNEHMPKTIHRLLNEDNEHDHASVLADRMRVAGKSPCRPEWPCEQGKESIMPRLNGTGPNGMGPATGRGMGDCAGGGTDTGAGTSGFAPGRGANAGLGLGRGANAGLGLGRGANAGLGLGRGANAGLGLGRGANAGLGLGLGRGARQGCGRRLGARLAQDVTDSSPLAEAEEKALLNLEATRLETQLQNVRTRLNAMEIKE